jgi:general secretion pathway protein I
MNVERCHGRRPALGFTLVEVLVALAIVAIALVAGLQATAALANNASRQSDLLLAQLCADNALIHIRLSRLLPALGHTTAVCEQGGRSLQLTLSVQATPNPRFRRVEAQVAEGNTSVLRLSTVVTHD